MVVNILFVPAHKIYRLIKKFSIANLSSAKTILSEYEFDGMLKDVVKDVNFILSPS
jgi:hypothetical protein